MTSSFRAAWRTALCALPLALAACGGGGDDAGSAPPALSCNATDRQQWVRSYLDDWYLWYALAPRPTPGSFATVEEYFDESLYVGGDLIPNGGGARWPKDDYSGFESTESFNRFYGAGQTLGYGVAVTGLEVTTPSPQPNAPLYVRYVEPRSPAATAGIVRGDRVLSIDGIAVSTLIAADDGFARLTPAAAGNTLTLVLRNAAGVDRTVVLTAAVYALTPVQNAQVVQSVGGRSIGYLTVKDMIEQTATPLADAFASFRAANVRELVLDLRYNGGGLVTVAAEVASYAAGSRASGQTFARLLYNDKRSANNRDYLFGNPANWAGFARVYVLAGPRTCSASEQVINGLRGAGVDVVAVGDTTCGKPVGFLPQSDGCGTTYSVVNFESVNARNEGRYFDGFQATCRVAEDFTRPVGALTDPLLVAAAYHVDNGFCPAGTGVREVGQSRPASPHQRYRGADGGERTGMSAR